MLPTASAWPMHPNSNAAAISAFFTVFSPSVKHQSDVSAINVTQIEMGLKLSLNRHDRIFILETNHFNLGESSRCRNTPRMRYAPSPSSATGRPERPLLPRRYCIG